MPGKIKNVINDKTTELVQTFNNLGCNMSYSYNKDLAQKLSRCQHVCVEKYKES